MCEGSAELQQASARLRRIELTRSMRGRQECLPHLRSLRERFCNSELFIKQKRRQRAVFFLGTELFDPAY